MSDQTPDLAALEALAEAATPTDWHAATPADDCPERTAAEYLAKTCANPDRHPTHLHAVWVPELSEGDGKPNLIIAFTGDGPTSQANAAYIAAAHPGTVLWLIREVRRLESDLYDACAVIDDARHALSPERPGPRVEPAKRVLWGETAHRLVSAWVDQRRRAVDPIPPHVRHHQRALDGGGSDA